LTVKLPPVEDAPFGLSGQVSRVALRAPSGALFHSPLERVFELLIDADEHELAGEVWDLWPELA
jgi:hypothetical protein